MVSVNIYLLLGVNFLHFLSTGLVAPVLTQHITSNGGNHIILGVLVAAIFFCNKVSKCFVTLFPRGNKIALTMVLFSSFLSYIVLVFFSSCWIICISRCFYELVNQIDLLSKEYLEKGPLKNGRVFNLLDVTKVAGIVLGSTAGGYIFEYTEDFGAIAMITSILTFLGILMLQYMDDQTTTPTKQESSLSLMSYHQIQNLFTLSPEKKWDKILLKSVYVLAFAIYFSRFAFLISFKFEVGSIIIGYSVAYQHMLKFACDSLVPLIQKRIKNKKSLFEYCLVICGFTLSGLCYAPSYEFYLIIFVPMIFTYTFINSLFANDVLELKVDKETGKAIETLDGLINIFAPICFGIICHIFGGQSFKLLVVFPIVVCIYLLNQRFLLFQKEGEDKVKED